MFDLGWDEMAVIAVVALVVLGPKELPNALKTVTGLMRQARKLAGEFQNGVNQIIREAELEDAKKAVAELNKNSISQMVEKHLDADGEVKSALQAVKEEPASPALSTEKPAVDTAALPDGTVAATAASETDVNPAVAAFAPGGSATRLPDIDETTPAVEGNLAETPVEADPVQVPGKAPDKTDANDNLRQAAASTLAAEGDEALKKIKVDQEVSKIS